MTAQRKKKSLIDVLEIEVRKALRDRELSNGERLKAIEVGAKILAIRHKIDEGIGGIGGAFFAK